MGSSNAKESIAAVGFNTASSFQKKALTFDTMEEAHNEMERQARDAGFCLRKTSATLAYKKGVGKTGEVLRQPYECVCGGEYKPTLRVESTMGKREYSSKTLKKDCPFRYTCILLPFNADTLF